MVRILSNGDIVPDDDPRAQTGKSSKNIGGNEPRQPMGSVHQTAYGQMNQGYNNRGMYMGEQNASLFDSLNQRLRALGIPQFAVGQWTVEPIILVGVVLAGLLFGLPGLLFAGLLFMVVKISQPGGNPFSGQGQQTGGSNQPGGGGSGGNRVLDKTDRLLRRQFSGLYRP